MRGKWTEGPWTVDGEHLRAIVRGADLTIVAVRHRLPAVTHGANAYLIAASPDLYEALEWLLASVEADPSAENYPGDREERLTLACGAARSALSLALPPKGDEL